MQHDNLKLWAMMGIHGKGCRLKPKFNMSTILGLDIRNGKMEIKAIPRICYRIDVISQHLKPQIDANQHHVI
jgi:hypothetical protein